MPEKELSKPEYIYLVRRSLNILDRNTISAFTDSESAFHAVGRYKERDPRWTYQIERMEANKADPVVETLFEMGNYDGEWICKNHRRGGVV